MSNDRTLVKPHENFVDYIPEVMNEGEHYYLRSKVDRSAKHYIGNKQGRGILISPTTEDEVTDILLDKLVKGEALTGTIDGANATFTTTFSFVPESIEVFVNGVLQRIIDDYNNSGASTIIFVISPELTDKLTINYIKA